MADLVEPPTCGWWGRLLELPIRLLMVVVAVMAVVAGWVAVEHRLHRLDEPGAWAAVLRAWGWIAAVAGVLELAGLAALWVIG